MTDKYHDTVTRFWCRFVGHVLDSAGPGAGIDELVGLAPLLADKAAVSRHWSPEAIASTAARRSWLEPDREPLSNWSFGPGGAGLR